MSEVLNTMYGYTIKKLNKALIPGCYIVRFGIPVNDLMKVRLDRKVLLMTDSSHIDHIFHFASFRILYFWFEFTLMI